MVAEKLHFRAQNGADVAELYLSETGVSSFSPRLSCFTLERMKRLAAEDIENFLQIRGKSGQCLRSRRAPVADDGVVSRVKADPKWTEAQPLRDRVQRHTGLVEYPDPNCACHADLWLKRGINIS